MNKKNAVNMLIVLFLFIVFYFYLTTAYPAFKNDDSPETIASGYTLGIAHPPGYPLFTLISKLFTYIPVGSIAFRLNIFAALLGLTVLLFSFVVIRKTVLLMFNTDIHSMIGIPALLILAFSYIFWNQAIEAKGGIYLLNLLFLVLLIYLSIELLINYNKKYLYLMSYILGLSLSNHWPSMIILIPVFSYFYFKYKDKINFSCILVHVLFVVLGLSAYLYLPIRAKTENIFLFMAKPDNWHDFWWTVTRSGYEYPKTEIIEMLKGPFFVFIKIFFKNYSFFWPFIFLGIYISFKMQRKLAILNSLICIIVSFIVVMYNRPLKEYLWLIEIFLLPALYVFWIFMVVGLVYVFNQLKNRIYKNIYLFLIILLMIFMTYKNYTYNNACNNYISYDFGENILRTIKKDSFYLAQGDYYNMPVCYFKYVKKINDIKYINLYSLQYKWGIENFIKKYGYVELYENNLTKNISNIIYHFSMKNKIYLSHYVKELELSLNDFKQIPSGILYEITNTEKKVLPFNVFNFYVYRGIYKLKTEYDKGIGAIYANAMAVTAYQYYNDKKYLYALDLYKKSLMLSDKINKADIYYNIALIYNLLSEGDNYLYYLHRTLDERKDFWAVYENIGMIYYSEKMYLIAKFMFENAIKTGSPNVAILQKYINEIDKMQLSKLQIETFNAAVSLLEKGNYNKATDIFNFLIKNRMMVDKIYKNIAVYHLKNNNYDKALVFFKKAHETNKTQETYLNMAYVYYKLGEKNKSLRLLKEAMNIYRNDPNIINLYNQIKATKKME